MATETPVKFRLKVADSLSRSLDRVGDRFGNLERRVGQLNKRFGRLRGTSGRAGNQFRRIGRLARTATKVIAGIGAGAAFGVGLAVKSFADYETSLVGLGKTTNLGGPKLAKLGDRFKELSKVIPASATELLDLGAIAAQLGVRGDDNLVIFSKTIARLGASSDLAGQEAATALATILNVTGELKDPKNVERLASSMVALGNNFNTTESRIARFSNELGRGISTFGATSAEVVGISAAFSSMGVKAEAGGSVITRTFQKIDTAVRRGGKGLFELTQIIQQSKEGAKLSSEDIVGVFKESSVKGFELFIKGLASIKGKEGDVTRALERFGLTGNRVAKVLPVIAKNFPVLAKALEMSRIEFAKNEALAKEAAAAFGTVSSKAKILGNRLRSGLIDFGEGLKPQTLETIKKLTNLFDAADKSGAFGRLGETLGKQIDQFQANLSKIFGFEDKSAIDVTNTIADKLLSASQTAFNAFELAFRAAKLLGGGTDTFTDVVSEFAANISQGDILGSIGIQTGSTLDRLPPKKNAAAIRALRQENPDAKFSDLIDRLKSAPLRQLSALVKRGEALETKSTRLREDEFVGPRRRNIPKSEKPETTLRKLLGKDLTKRESARIEIDFKNLPRGTTIRTSGDDDILGITSGFQGALG